MVIEIWQEKKSSRDADFSWFFNTSVTTELFDSDYTLFVLEFNVLFRKILVEQPCCIGLQESSALVRSIGEGLLESDRHEDDEVGVHLIYDTAPIAERFCIFVSLKPSLSVFFSCAEQFTLRNSMSSAQALSAVLLLAKWSTGIQFLLMLLS